MAQLHVFNPSHDEALAADLAQYFPTRAARRQAAEGAMLPALWAKDGDGILCLSESYRAEEARVVILPQREILTGSLMREWLSEVEIVQPWGWDTHIVRVLTRLGVRREVMPDDKTLTRLRSLSSRETSVRLLADIKSQVAAENFVGESRFCRTTAEIRQAISQFDNDAVLKMPWSCSGRGVTFTRNTPDNRLDAIIRKGENCGGLAVEPYYNLRQNFGAEYLYHEGRPELIGLSCFDTRGAGQYGGNITQTQEQTLGVLRAMLADPGHLDLALEAVAASLSRILGTSYDGPLGIDMAITADGRLHPCIELNLRRTMGHVALCRAQNTNNKL